MPWINKDHLERIYSRLAVVERFREGELEAREEGLLAGPLGPRASEEDLRHVRDRVRELELVAQYPDAQSLASAVQELNHRIATAKRDRIYTLQAAGTNRWSKRDRYVEELTELLTFGAKQGWFTDPDDPDDAVDVEDAS